MKQLGYETVSSQYATALQSVRMAKNVIMALVALAIVIQLVGFILVDFVGVTDAVHAAAVPQATTQEAVIAATDRSVAATTWDEILSWVLPAMKFLAVVSSMLLVLTLLLAVKLSLLGRLGGVAGFISGFFWSLVLLAMVVPWQQTLKGSFACGALYNMGELVSQAKQFKSSWGGSGSWLDGTLYYARFIVYPLITLVVWMVVQTRFTRGYEQLRTTSPIAPTNVDQPVGPVE